MAIILVSAEDISTALMRSQCDADETTVDQLSGVLLMAQTRLETSLGIDSFERAQYTDIFEIEDDSDHHLVRLVNGFVVASIAPVATQVAPNTATAPYDRLLPDLGVIRYKGMKRGERYSITYTSGFEKDDKNVAKNVPDWLRGICITMILHWYRIGILNPRVPEGASYTAIIDSAIREILARVYMRYDRPRVGVVFAERGVYGPGN